MSVASKVLRRVQRAALNSWAAGQPRFHVATRRGRVTIPGTPGTGWVLSWKRDWKTQLIEACLHNRPGMLIDVGANIGQTLLDYCDTDRDCGYVAFEPSPRCAEHLSSIIALNRLIDCAVVTAALSDRNDILPFFAGDAADPGASLVADVDPNKTVTRSLVPSYRFDDIVATVVGDRPISFIKIDVEGAEDAVMAGMVTTLEERRPLITCEVLNRVATADAESHHARNARTMATLKKAGYRAHRIIKTPGEHLLAGIEQIDKFPDTVFSAKTMYDVDYLFVPAEQNITLP